MVPDKSQCSFNILTFVYVIQGIIPALAKVFPSAEHRFCLRHIHENMKHNWNGQAYKDHLWRCATATTVPHFELAMEELKKFNSEAFEWLAKIPAHSWSRSHFTGKDCICNLIKLLMNVIA